MSEPKAEYTYTINTHPWLPQGEYTPPAYIPDEPDRSEYLNAIGRHITRLENLRSELNLAWLDIEPWIEQTKKLRKSKDGFKLCYPCADKFYAALTNLSREIQALREELNNK